MAEAQSTADTILTVISVVAPIFTVLVTIGGIANEYSSKDDDGNRRVTRAGKIAMGLAACGLLTTLATNIWKSYQTSLDKESARKAKQDEALLALQARAEQDRNDREERQWKAFKDKYDAALTALAMRETRKQAAGVISNQRVLAAIEKTRDDLKTAYLADRVAKAKDFVTSKIELNNIWADAMMICKGVGKITNSMPNYFDNIKSFYITVNGDWPTEKGDQLIIPRFIETLRTEEHEPVHVRSLNPASGYMF